MYYYHGVFVICCVHTNIARVTSRLKDVAVPAEFFSTTAKGHVSVQEGVAVPAEFLSTTTKGHVWVERRRGARGASVSSHCSASIERFERSALHETGVGFPANYS